MSGESLEIVPGAKITAAQFNDLVVRYNKFWQGDSYTFDEQHQTDPERRYGWGQPQSIYPVVSSYETITAAHTNHLVAQLNAGMWHMNEDNLPYLLPFRSPQTSVLASVYSQVMGILDTVFEPYKFLADAVGEWSTPAIISNPGSSPWADSLQCEMKYSFTDYNEARNYFNSGGQLSISLTAANGTLTSSKWKDLFDSIGEIRIGADFSITTGDNKGTYTNKGFYDLISLTTSPGDPDYPAPHPYVTIFDAGGWQDLNFGAYGGVYSSAYGAYATIYLQSEYNSRRVQILLRGDDSGATFDIYMRILLLEDEDDTSPIDSDVTAVANFLEIFETPEPTDPNISYFTVPTVGTVYQFSAPTNPVMSPYTIWTEVVHALGPQLTPDWNEGASDLTPNDPGTNWIQTPDPTDSQYAYQTPPTPTP